MLRIIILLAVAVLGRGGTGGGAPVAFYLPAPWFQTFLVAALVRSEEEIPQQEGVYVQEALLRSKAYHPTKLIVARLTSRSLPRESSALRPFYARFFLSSPLMPGDV